MKKFRVVERPIERSGVVEYLVQQKFLYFFWDTFSVKNKLEEALYRIEERKEYLSRKKRVVHDE